MTSLKQQYEEAIAYYNKLNAEVEDLIEKFGYPLDDMPEHGGSDYWVDRGEMFALTCAERECHQLAAALHRQECVARGVDPDCHAASIVLGEMYWPDDDDCEWALLATRAALEPVQTQPVMGVWVEAVFDPDFEDEDSYRFLRLTGDVPVIESWNWDTNWVSAHKELKINYEDLEVLFGEATLSTREEWVDDEDDREPYQRPWVAKTAFLERDGEDLKVKAFYGESLSLPIGQARDIFKPQIRRLMKEHLQALLQGRRKANANALDGVSADTGHKILSWLGLTVEYNEWMGWDGEEAWGDLIQWGLLPNLIWPPRPR